MLQKWLVEEYILGPDGVGNENITGVFIDDYWCYGEDCHDPVQGASEIDKHQQADMGLSNEQIKAISIAWRANMDAVHKALLSHKAFAWDLFPNQHNAGCGAGPEITKANCHAALSSQCNGNETDSNGGLYRNQALYYGLTKGDLSAPSIKHRLPDLAQDLVRFSRVSTSSLRVLLDTRIRCCTAAKFVNMHPVAQASFLLVRGEFAWLGYGFLGCAAQDNYTQPSAFSEDYGAPSNTCHPVDGKPGVYAREYSKATVTLDCNEWRGSIVMKQGARTVDMNL